MRGTKCAGRPRGGVIKVTLTAAPTLFVRSEAIVGDTGATAVAALAPTARARITGIAFSGRFWFWFGRAAVVDLHTGIDAAPLFKALALCQTITCTRSMGASRGCRFWFSRAGVIDLHTGIDAAPLFKALALCQTIRRARGMGATVRATSHLETPARNRKHLLLEFGTLLAPHLGLSGHCQGDQH
jgi:hypothetical protein